MAAKRKPYGFNRHWDQKVKLKEATCWAEIQGYYMPRRAIWAALCGFHCAVLFGRDLKAAERLAYLCIQYFPKMSKADWAILARIYERIDVVLPRSEELHAQGRVIDASMTNDQILGTADRPGELALAHFGIVVMRDAWKFEASTTAKIANCLRSGYAASGLPCFAVLLATTRQPKKEDVSRLMPLLELSDVLVDIDLELQPYSRERWGRPSRSLQTELSRTWRVQQYRQKAYNSALPMDRLELLCWCFDDVGRAYMREYRSKMGELFHEKKLRVARTNADVTMTKDMSIQAAINADDFLCCPVNVRDALIEAGGGTGYDERLLDIHPPKSRKVLKRVPSGGLKNQR